MSAHPVIGHLARNLAAHERRWGITPTATRSDKVRIDQGRWPRVSIRNSQGSWVPVGGDRSPAEEAADWLEREAPALGDATLVCVVGLGLGEVIGVLAERRPDVRILALEPEPGLLGPAMDRHDWTLLIETGRLMLLAGPDYAGRAAAWRLVTRPAESPAVLLHPVIARERSADTRAAAQVIGQAVAGARANAQARARFAAPYLLNTLRNLPQFTRARDVRAGAGRHLGRPAIVAAAGPSLNRNLAELAALPDWRQRAVVVAVDTALKPMLAAGIAPHYVVAVDPGEANAATLAGLPPLPDTWLVGEASLDPRCFDGFADRTVLFRVSDTHAPWPWLAEHGIAVGQLRAWGSVLTTAYDFALQAGCDPIVFIGADLAYTDGQPYCRDTIYEDRWAAAVAAGSTLQEVWRRQLPDGELVAVDDVRGGTTYSSRTLVAFRDWLAAQAPAAAPRRIVNATGAGILVGAGIEQASVGDAVNRSHPGAAASIAGSTELASIVAPDTLAAALHDARRLVARPGPPAPVLAQWREFSGDAFDRHAVGTALDEAGHRLAAWGARPTVPMPAPRGHHAGAAPPAVGERDLPEALARFHAAMTGSWPLPALASADTLTVGERMALLREALELLGRIRDELRDVDELPSAMSSGLASIGAVAYRWPDRLRRAVLSFEARLGRAWLDGARGAQRAFFVAPVTPRDGDVVGECSHAGHAAALLAREWLACWASLGTSPEVHEPLARLMGLESAVRATAPNRTTECVDLRLDTRLGGEPVSLTLPFGLDEAALGRVLTGVVRARSDAPRLALPAIETDTLTVTVAPRTRPAESDPPPRPLAVIQPRALADARIRRSAIAYPVEDGVVCVPPNDTRSYLVHGDGRVTLHHDWPRRIVSELPLGTDGAIAWASGRADPSNVVPPYVMYRRTARETPTIEDLPFNPAWGAWWNERVYWGYLPSMARDGRGLASWAPGHGPRIEADDVTLFAIHPGDSGLLLEPSTRRPDNGYERRRLARGWTWHPDHGLEPRALDPHGARSSRATGGGWTATAYPEADLVTLCSAAGARLAMTVYYPFRVAWLGSSLLVSTVHHELIAFDGLVDALAPWRHGV